MAQGTAAQEIAAGVYWIDGGSSNFYLCVEDDGLTLVDAGMPRREGLVWRLLAELGRQPAELRRILVTHADLDHVGSAAALQAATGARVFASAMAAELLVNGRSPAHMPALVQFFLRFIKYRPIPADAIEVVQPGQVLPLLGGVQVLATPGHTLDHVSFYGAAAGVVFVGDALNTRDGVLQPTPPRITADHAAARDSARRLRELAPAVYACGHGAPLAVMQRGP
ncbi:MAG: MBL fold metallo-hydrolase [Anaerolineales bacterium]|nr:MBL fold metallo-hydrolase [Anaerolineales bacterium]